MKVAILSANLRNFDKPQLPVQQDWDDAYVYYCYTDDVMPPIADLSGRFQYRIPKLFGWELLPDYDAYIWLDGSMTFERPDCLKWFVQQLGDADAAFFRHPVRRNVRQEVAHINEKLEQGNTYITSRYKGGLHNEMLEVCMADKTFKDKRLFASTAFIYRNTEEARDLMRWWWFYQSRYYTCDQVNLPYAIHQSDAKVNTIDENLFKIGYLSLISHHQ